MDYNFNTVVNRRDSYSVKWRRGKKSLPNELPMWVADMDFSVAPEIREGLQEILSHGVFGYSIVPTEYYTSILSWWTHRYGFTMDESWIIPCSGVISTISSVIRAASERGDKVLLQSPVYHVFYRCITENGREVVSNDLVYEDGKYRMDFEDLEEKLKDPKTKIMLLCSPHNPVGKIWDEVTLKKIGFLCHKYGVLVVADEIHCDLTFCGQRYTPFASVDETCRNISVSTFSPSKTFNIADLHTAFAVIPNEDLRRRLKSTFASDHIGEVNSFGLKASVLAYSKGHQWLDSLLGYLEENRIIVKEFLDTQVKEIQLVPSLATYLLWMDCSQFTNDATLFCNFMREKTGLWVSRGGDFGKNGEAFFRMNIATSQSRLHDGLERLKKSVESFRLSSVDR